jgi:hypothetical protein
MSQSQGRLFVLELSAGKIFSMSPNGTDFNAHCANRTASLSAESNVLDVRFLRAGLSLRSVVKTVTEPCTYNKRRLLRAAEHRDPDLLSLRN